MPMVAQQAPYTLFVVDDDEPTSPREDCDPCLQGNGRQRTAIFISIGRQTLTMSNAEAPRRWRKTVKSRNPYLPDKQAKNLF